jgi:hypothetical protein
MSSWKSGVGIKPTLNYHQEQSHTWEGIRLGPIDNQPIVIVVLRTPLPNTNQQRDPHNVTHHFSFTFLSTTV